MGFKLKTATFKSLNVYTSMYKFNQSGSKHGNIFNQGGKTKQSVLVQEFLHISDSKTVVNRQDLLYNQTNKITRQLTFVLIVMRDRQQRYMHQFDKRKAFCTVQGFAAITE